MDNNGEFNLHEFPEERLNYVLAMPEEERLSYFASQIKKHYPIIPIEEYERLLTAYESSFILEKIYRSNKTCQEGFTAVYTKTGLIRNMVNDIFFTDDDLITH